MSLIFEYAGSACLPVRLASSITAKSGPQNSPSNVLPHKNTLSTLPAPLVNSTDSISCSEDLPLFCGPNRNNIGSSWKGRCTSEAHQCSKYDGPERMLRAPHQGSRS